MEEKKEYIIEFAEDPTKCYLVLLKNGDDGLPFMKKKTVRPYKKPDIEAIRKEEHDKGFKEGMDFSLGKAAQEKYYQRGLEDGKAEGREEIWECMKKANGMPATIVMEIFGKGFSSLDSILDHMTAAEAIEKLRSYEGQKDKIKIGDQLVNPWGTKGVVLNAHPRHDGSMAYTVWWKDKEHGRYEKSDWQEGDCKKTGMYFPEAARMLINPTTALDLLQKMDEME